VKKFGLFIFIFVVISMIFAVSFSVAAAKFTVVSPKDKIITQNTRINILGSAYNPKEISINGIKVPYNKSGEFSAIALLKPGKNLIQINALFAGQEKLSFKARLIKKITFDDIESYPKKRPHWATKQITDLSTLGIIEGYPDNNFMPDQPISRGELATWLTRAKGLKLVVPTADVYYDVPKEHWRAPYIKAVTDYGLMKGISNDRFGMDRPIKRKEAVEVFARAYNLKPETTKIKKAFSDITREAAYSGVIYSAYSQGFVMGYPGKDTKFAPDIDMNRAEAAILISNLPNIKTAISKLYDFNGGFSSAQYSRIGTRPLISSFMISPSKVLLDGVTPVKISAKVTDAQGPADITQVWADIRVLGGPNNARLSTTESGAYELVFMPTIEAETGDKQLVIKALDKAGLESESSLKFTIVKSIK
jgi:hypothetical protein